MSVDGGLRKPWRTGRWTPARANARAARRGRRGVVVPLRRRTAWREVRRRAGWRLPPLAALAALLAWQAAGPEPVARNIDAVRIWRMGESGCRFHRAVDGDTIDALCAGRVVRVRLMGFDAPETADAACLAERRAGDQATAALRRIVRGEAELRIALDGVDRYGRRLGRMFVGGRDVARMMIERGLARRYDGGVRFGWC